MSSSQHSTHLVRYLIWSLVLFCASAIGQELCYFPDKSLVNADNGGPYLPCNSSASGGSACCTEIAMCTDTGYCIGHYGLYYRGGCTESDWNVQACAQQCLDVQTNSFSNIVFCGDNGGGQTWCCDGVYTDSCCDDDSAVFTDTSLPGTYWWHPPNGPSSSTSAGTFTSSIASHTSTSSQIPTASSGNSKSPDLGVAVGAGIGAPLGVLAIGILVWLFLRERRKAGKLQEQWRQQWQAEMERRSAANSGQDNKAYQGPSPHAGWNELSNLPPRELAGPPPRELYGQNY